MDLSRYISILVQNQYLNAKAGIVADELLKFFVKYPKCSTYQTHKYLKEIYKAENKTISYKNVYKRIQKLYQLKLINKVKNETTTKHGAIYYSLSTLGIFYIFKNQLVFQDKNIIIENRFDSLFQNFLYPYIDFNTINRIIDIQIIIRIYHYLHKCCIIISDIIDTLKEIQKDGGIYIPITSTRRLLDPKNMDDLNDFIKYLKARYKLKWLKEKDYNININNNDFCIIITSKKRKLYLKLYPEEGKAILSTDNKIISDLIIKKDNTDITGYEILEYKSGDFNKWITNYSKGLADDISTDLYKLCYDILEYINYIDIYPHLKQDEKEKNKKIVKQDKNLLKLVNQFKKQFDSYYYNFTDLK